jgi:pimeloyl-ACP methyl ester carboxylesterase
VQLQADGKAVFAYTAAHDVDSAKRTIVFLHGAGLDHSSWGLQSRYFGYHGFNVLALDLPAHGRSEGPPLNSIGDMADWVKKILDEKKISAAVVVGHSMGALVALEFAARYPDATEKIALIGIAYPMKVSGAFLEAARRNDPAAYDMDTIWGHAPQVPFGADPSPGMWMYGDTLARLGRLAPGVLHSGLNACNEYSSGLESAAQLKCPVLFVLGGRDMMTPPRGAEDLMKKIGHSKSVRIATSGHTLMAEAPDATLDALIGFLA